MKRSEALAAWQAVCVVLQRPDLTSQVRYWLGRNRKWLESALRSGKEVVEPRLVAITPDDLGPEPIAPGVLFALGPVLRC